MKLRGSALKRCNSTSGSTLVTVVVTGAILGLVTAGTMALGSFQLRMAHGRNDWIAAYHHAENALHWAAQMIADAWPAPSSGVYATADGTLSLPYMQQALQEEGSRFAGARVTVVKSNLVGMNIYWITASARVGEKVRTIGARIVKNPASRVFDYEYFLNNWGWWWGSTITGNGGNRANWDFDFRGRPSVNGVILANGLITENGVPVNPFTSNPPFGGLAGANPLAYAHWGVPREPMPNLKDLSYYAAKAMMDPARNGIWVGTQRVVYGVHTNAQKPGLYLEGTYDRPIVISNTVVVPGDVVIKGYITGRGTLYVGGNLYIAGDLMYRNGPSFATPPETMSPSQRDAWVQNNQNKDLVAFAVRECILGGDVTSANWVTYCYNAAVYGLRNVGSELNLGADGILHTGDDGIPFLHPDGTWSAWYDADEDGVMDGNYDYNTQLNMTTSRASKIQGYPTTQSGTPVAYSSVASNNMNRLDGIFYTNHAAAMRLARANAVINGVLVSRDEAIIFDGSLRLNYDSRVHSRYNRNPNLLVDLGLPVAGLISLSDYRELPPETGTL
jgi:hypothetical protein